MTNSYVVALIVMILLLIFGIIYSHFTDNLSLEYILIFAAPETLQIGPHIFYSVLIGVGAYISKSIVLYGLAIVLLQLVLLLATDRISYHDNLIMLYINIVLFGIIAVLLNKDTRSSMMALLLYCLSLLVIKKYQTTRTLNLKSKRIKYILRHYKYYKKKYMKLILSESALKGNILQLFFVVMAVENANRPKLVRTLEYCWAIILRRKNMSTGIMQVQHAYPLKDSESVQLAAKLFKRHEDESSHSDLAKIAQDYNGSKRYSDLVMLMYDEVTDAGI